MPIFKHIKNSKYIETYLKHQQEIILLERFLNESLESFQILRIKLQKEYDKYGHLLNTPLSDVKEITSVVELMEQSRYTMRSFPSFTFSNLLLSVYSIFETHLIQMIFLMDEKSKPEKPFNPLNGDFLIKSKDQIKKTIDFDISEEIESWNKVNELRIIRNFIIHYYNDLDLYKKVKKEDKINELIDIVNKYTGIQFVLDKLLIISESIIFTFGEVCGKLLLSIANKCEEKYDEFSYLTVYDTDKMVYIEKSRKIY